MPVRTAASVKAMTSEGVAATGAHIMLGNTYHLMLRPGASGSPRWAGCTSFMNWPYAILTDSGGRFQVMSLAKLRTIGGPASPFARISTAARYLLTPERSIEIQRLLGADARWRSTSARPIRRRARRSSRRWKLSMHSAERSRRAL